MEKYFVGVGPKVLFTALKSWTEEEEICDKRKEWSDVRSLLRRSNQTLRDSDKLSSSSQRPNWFLLWSCDVLDSLAAERLIKLVQERGAALSQSSSVYSHSQSRLNFRTKSLVSPSFSKEVIVGPVECLSHLLSSLFSILQQLQRLQLTHPETLQSNYLALISISSCGCGSSGSYWNIQTTNWEKNKNSTTRLENKKRLDRGR